MKPSAAAIDALVRSALAEDAPWGDISSQLLPAETRVTAQLVARQPGVLCGAELVRAAFTITDSSIATQFHVEDGATFATNTTLATIEGPARTVLQAERVALNFVQRLSGIATFTAKFVRETAGTHAQVTDTRKTTPTLRLFERYAVRCGGGHNHRYSLSDAVMLKDNHLAVLAAAGVSLSEAVAQARDRLPHTTHVEIEVDRLDQIDTALAAGAHTVLLDNFSMDDLRAAVAHINGRALTEASGGVALATVAAIAATGVDLISVGALTHSAPALDIGLDITV